jgi:hypothetical protein
MTWSITQIKVSDSPMDGTIVVASFSVTDGTSTVSSDTQLLAANAAEFVPLNDVTEAQCVAWVKEALGGQVAVYEAKVAALTSAVEPEVVPLPWAN